MLLKIFAFSDIHSPDSCALPKLRADEFDLIITLGDIPADTFDYILLMSRTIHNVGVLGNHDPEDIPGLNDLHGKIVEYKGIKIGGFGGSQKYKNQPNHYTENEVHKKIRKFPPVDLFISHAPPFSVSLKEDYLHQGFKAFDDYIDKNVPKYWLHGHLGNNYKTVVGATTVIGINQKQPLWLEF